MRNKTVQWTVLSRASYSEKRGKSSGLFYPELVIPKSEASPVDCFIPKPKNKKAQGSPVDCFIPRLKTGERSAAYCFSLSPAFKILSIF